MILKNSNSFKNAFFLFDLFLIIMSFYFFLTNRIFFVYVIFLIASPIFFSGYLLSWMCHKRKAKFRCIKCGLCCRLRVKLNERDITRLKKIKGWENFINKRNYLKRVNGWCVFLKKRRSNVICSIYKYRPSTCRKWPFFCVTRFSISWIWFSICPSLRKLITK